MNRVEFDRSKVCIDLCAVSAATNISRVADVALANLQPMDLSQLQPQDVRLRRAIDLFACDLIYHHQPLTFFTTHCHLLHTAHIS